jgi:Leucine-rich repeat (LRR) protein
MGQMIEITYKGKVLQKVEIDVTFLYLCNWDIEDIPEIQGVDCLVNLETLSLSSNRITRIEGLDRLVNLEELDLSSNRVTRIEGLGRLVNLKELNLSTNQITRTDGLEQLVNLEVLWLSSNKITRIEGLDRLVNLEELYLSSNQITRIEGLGRLVHLKTLSLEDTEIPFTFFDDMGGLLFKEYGVFVKKPQAFVKYCKKTSKKPQAFVTYCENEGTEEPEEAPTEEHALQSIILSRCKYCVKELPEGDFQRCPGCGAALR